MQKYQILGNRVKLSDERFDVYLDESLSFFSALESVAGSPPSIAFEDSNELVEWRNKRWENLREAISNCRHKIQAINYNISLIKSEIKLPPIIGQKVVPIHLDETEFLDDVILFEFESLLSQLMSTLDVFVYLLRLFYPSLDSEEENQIGFRGKRGRAGKNTVKKLKKESPQLAAYIDEQVGVWIQRVYDLRNMAVHKSKVHSLQMFLVDGSGIYSPMLSDDGVDLLLFCEDTYANLKKFLFHIEKEFLISRAGGYYNL